MNDVNNDTSGNLMQDMVVAMVNEGTMTGDSLTLMLQQMENMVNSLSALGNDFDIGITFDHVKNITTGIKIAAADGALSPLEMLAAVASSFNGSGVRMPEPSIQSLMSAEDIVMAAGSDIPDPEIVRGIARFIETGEMMKTPAPGPDEPSGDNNNLISIPDTPKMQI